MNGARDIHFRFLKQEVFRFFTVAVVGLALDLIVAWCAARLLGVPLWQTSPEFAEAQTKHVFDKDFETHGS